MLVLIRALGCGVYVSFRLGTRTVLLWGLLGYLSVSPWCTLLVMAG